MHNECSPTISPHPQRNVVPPQAAARENLSEESGSPDRLDSASKVTHQAAWVLAYASETRQAKIHQLQEALKSDTYQVTAEQIAAAMLRDTLRDLPPNSSPAPCSCQ
jgi:anti-sigma28 factor (negative regulator of flagellin synthesis)